MSDLVAPVWHEGMHLAQHHFQAQHRYFEELTGYVVSELLFKPYGIGACEFDAESLRNDVVALTQARGVMPDGLVFDFPTDALPEPIEIRSRFSPTQESQRVLLALPRFRAGQANLVEGTGGADRRFRLVNRTIRDEALGGDELSVPFAEKNFRLLLEGEENEDLTSLPLARIRRDGAGHFVFDRTFVAPCLHIGASERLMKLIGTLVEMLTARSDSVAASRLDSPGDLINYWLGNTLNSALGPLANLQRTRKPHPEQLFAELLRLAGALCTFSMSAHPRELPDYDHDNLDVCFGDLERNIHELLKVVVPTGGVRIPLEPIGESLYTGRVTDERCLGNAQWYLGVRSTETPAEIAARVPRLMKVCSAKFIERLVREAFPGLPMHHVPQPPPQISPRLGMEYFVVPGSGPCWASIVETREVGVYAPAAITDAELELVVAIESNG